MKIPKIKLFCFLFLVLLSIDAYSQLKPKSRAGSNNGDEECFYVDGGQLEYCTAFTLPVENLTFDWSGPMEGCYPANNFGCDLHIGLTYEGDGSTTYIQITKCLAKQITTGDNYENYGADDVEPYPIICVQFPFDLKNGCDEDDELAFSLGLYCKDSNGDFHPISSDTNNDWESVFPDNEDGDSIIDGESWSSTICCDISPHNGGYEFLTPFIGQSDDGSTVFIRDFKDISKVSISVFDANNQNVDITAVINIISNFESSIDFTQLDSGIYFVRAIDNNIVYSKTIIKL